MQHLLPSSVLLLAAATAGAAEVGYYGQPALHGDRLIFVSEGDLWTASVAETDAAAPITAYRLTSSDGSESWPHISSDGQWIAFTGQYGGNTDVYIMPVDGGAPKRLTFHPGADEAVGWLPDSRSVLVRSARVHPHGRTELWRISVAGGMPRRYELGECSMAGFSATGKRIAFTRWSNEGWDWKRYRGGTAPEIWVGDIESSRFARLTDDPASDLFPMWLRGRVHFLSDRDGAPNIYSDRPGGGDLRQLTAFAPDPSNPTDASGYDVRWPSADAQRRGTRIAFCQAGGLALLDVESGQVRRLDVRLASDRVAARQRFAEAAATLTDFELSHDGKTILLESRGEILTVPVEGGAPRQLTRTSSAREWGATYLDDDTIVLISDAAGEQQVAVAPANGAERPSLITEDREAWLFPPVCAADAQSIAFADKTMRLHIFEMASMVRRQVDQAEGGEITDYRFSPDGQWLAYVKPMPNQYGSIHLYSVRTGRTFALSNPMHDDAEPRWDPAGKYLYFISNRHLDPVMGHFDMEHVYLASSTIVVVPLAADTPPPLPRAARAVEFDLEAWASDSEEDAEDGEEEDGPEQPDDGGRLAEEIPDPGDVLGGFGGVGDAIDPIRLDTEGLSTRQHILPIEPGRYGELEALRGSITWLEHPPAEGLLADDFGAAGLGKGEAKLRRYAFVEEEAKTLATDVSAYRVNRARDRIAVPREHGFDVIDLSSNETEKVGMESVRIRVDMPAEWGQILAEAWRLQRDFYWAPNMVGVDWPAMRVKYEALLDRVGTRRELNDLIGEMIGELGTSHTYIWGGDEHDEVEPRAVGVLGADIALEGGAFRVRRILPDDPWDRAHRSPLAAAYLGIEPGSVIEAINGMPLTPFTNMYDLLQNQADKTVRLTVADDVRGVNRRTVEVTTLASDRPLRYAAWVETNRRYVAEASQGKLGYVHIPNMGGDGLAAFSKLFYAQIDKSGMVIDVRDNGGGFVSQMIIARLARRPLAYDQPRHGPTMRYPYRSLHGHQVVLIDQHAGSDGDIFPATFRTLGLGPLIGTRTWGGVVGIRGDKPFVDFGLSTQPEYAWWEAKGGWSIENDGVAPDIEVRITPEDRLAGVDPQLDRAIAYLLEKLESEPIAKPAPPPYPVRAGGR